MDASSTSQLDDNAPAVPSRAMWDATELAREVETLAEALPFLVARDDERPPLWLSTAFGAQVAAVRSRLSSIATHRGLATRFRFVALDERVESGRFETAARRLAADAVSVAFAIRWLEIHSDTRLPSWPELLRGRSLRPPGSDIRIDVALWFG
jgi:hypothetical protein